MRRLADSGQDSMKLWNVVNEIIGRKNSRSFIESEGVYLTKPLKIILMTISLTRYLQSEIKCV